MEEVTVDVFLRGAQELLNGIRIFFTQFEDENLSSFLATLVEKIRDFKTDKYKISEFSPYGVLFNFGELEKLKEYVNKKISDFEKEVKETEKKVLTLSDEKTSLESDIKRCEKEISDIKFEDLKPHEDVLNFYKKQKEKLEKNWWKPWHYKLEVY